MVSQSLNWSRKSVPRLEGHVAKLAQFYFTLRIGASPILWDGEQVDSRGMPVKGSIAASTLVQNDVSKLRFQDSYLGFKGDQNRGRWLTLKKAKSQDFNMDSDLGVRHCLELVIGELIPKRLDFGLQ
ncbi:hypothetical protein VNO77_02767 [Canavalia gladiata]|uniref:Uncharacterized protein n=1 Tax=Canavalia gladiata TaxID=3824 RepID=A0AAN9MYT4_CANGL